MKKLLFLFPLAVSLYAVVTVAVARYDTNATGWNSAETVLTRAAVASAKFGKLGTYSVDGYIMAQPLYLPGITIAGHAYNVVIVASLTGNIYAFNADAPGSGPLWSRLVNPPWTLYPTSSLMMGSPLGCMSTPVYSGGYLYAVCMSSAPQWLLYKIDVTTGTITNSVGIAGQYPGTGCPVGADTKAGGNVIFNAQVEQQRSALTIGSGNVYVSFAGLGDNTVCWHGWIMGYDLATLAQTGVFLVNPSGNSDGIWMSGAAPSIDGSGNVYVTTGDGDYDGTANYGDTALKLSPTLQLLDWFTPANQASLSANDEDLSSNRFLLIPGTHLGVVAAKSFDVFLIDTACMGHLQGSSGCSLQTFKTNAVTPGGVATGSYGMAYGNNTLYLPLTNGPIYAFSFLGSAFNTTPVILNNTYGTFGPAQMAGSSNSTNDGILWAVTNAQGEFSTARPGVLRAMHSGTLAELWNSGTSLGNGAKFNSPTIANGRVYAPTLGNGLAVFGLANTGEVNGPALLKGPAVIK